MCHVIMYSQKGESREGPVGKCASSVAMDAFRSPNREFPSKAPTGIDEGTVHLHHDP